MDKSGGNPSIRRISAARIALLLYVRPILEQYIKRMLVKFNNGFSSKGDEKRDWLISQTNARLNQNVEPLTKNWPFADHSTIPSCIPTSC
jgi:hypothetical protein